MVFLSWKSITKVTAVYIREIVITVLRGLSLCLGVLILLWLPYFYCLRLVLVFESQQIISHCEGFTVQSGDVN